MGRGTFPRYVLGMPPPGRTVYTLLEVTVPEPLALTWMQAAMIPLSRVFARGGFFFSPSSLSHSLSLLFSPHYCFFILPFACGQMPRDSKLSVR